MSDEPTEKLELWITPLLREAIERQALEEGRHITSMARLLIERALQERARRKQTVMTNRGLPPPKPRDKRRAWERLR